MAKVGRPTKYKPEYCDTVIEIMAQGASKAECCVKLGVTPQTFLNWIAANPEFLESVKLGSLMSKAWWEEKGRNATFGLTEGFNATSYIFNMKNRFRESDDFGESWADRVQNENTHLFPDLTDEQLDERIEKLIQN
jgi:transposase